MDDLGVYDTGLSSRLAPLLCVPPEPGELAAQAPGKARPIAPG